MKKVISCVVFCLITVFLLYQTTDVLTPKAQNRYYILEKYLEANPEQSEHDVQVFGSCHSYTSFNPVYMEERTGVSGFVYGNAGEIIPTTYARMLERFDEHVPKVALVEIWGINPYETYSSHDRVFGFYLANNLERVPMSREKLEIIRDFDTIDSFSMHFPIGTYKDRLMDGSLSENDFNYTFESTKPYSTKYMFSEMTSRLAFNGFKKNASKMIEDYPQKQKYIAEGEFLEIEPDIVKYIQKIIDLCKENNVELIFYRSPYTSKVNELKKLNHLQQICDENEVLFIDLESELKFSYITDFIDYQHLSEIGANKATEFMIPYILDALEKHGQINDYPADSPADDLIFNGNFTDPINTGGKTTYVGKGENINGWRSNYSDDEIVLTEDGIRNTNKSRVIGWHMHQVLENVESLHGKSLTGVFRINDFGGENMRIVISCRDAEDKEIKSGSVRVAMGTVSVSCVVPENTEYIRVGVFAYEGVTADEYVVLESAALYEGAYTVDTLPENVNAYPADKIPGNLLVNGNFAAPLNTGGKTTYIGKGESIDGWKSNYSNDEITLEEDGVRNTNYSQDIGWHMHQVLEDADSLCGKALTGAFQINDYGGENMRMVISCRDAEDKEIRAASVPVEKGVVMMHCIVPENTQRIRVGVFAYEGVTAEDYVVLGSAALYKGTYTIENLPRQINAYPADRLPDNLLINGNFADPLNTGGKTTYIGKGESIDGWKSNYSNDEIALEEDGVRNTNYSQDIGWHMHQVLEDVDSLRGNSLTGVFQINDYGGENMRMVISCRDAEDKEIKAASAPIAKGVVKVSCVVPENTERIRIGVFAYEGVTVDDYVVLETAALYKGTYTTDALPKN